ncbi:MAG: hypothetical protein MJK12_04710 [Colwellia sp.]|nr:hypothetical protein [Colwellia sp.]
MPVLQKKMFTFPKTILLSIGVLGFIYSNSVIAGVTTTETEKYLVIATGTKVSFDMSNVELGADQEVLSTGSPGTGEHNAAFNGAPNTAGVFLNKATSWKTHTGPPTDSATYGQPNYLPGSRPLFEGIDYSGNVAITGSTGEYKASNVDLYANRGVDCTQSAGSCFDSGNDGNARYFQDSGDLDNSGVGLSNGTTNTDLTTSGTGLLDELADIRDWLIALDSDVTWTNNSQEMKDLYSGAITTDGIVFTDLDALDTNNDGYAVIDLNFTGSNDFFHLNNTDWILKSDLGTQAIFRLADGSHFKFIDSSIMLGDSQGNTRPINELGAIFFTDTYTTENTVFDLQNVILGGIGLWDFTDFNPRPSNHLQTEVASSYAAFDNRTKTNISNAQGCAQFIGNSINMSNNRWNRCSETPSTPRVDIPEPSIVWLFALSLLIFWRKNIE